MTAESAPITDDAHKIAHLSLQVIAMKSALQRIASGVDGASRAAVIANNALIACGLNSNQ